VTTDRELPRSANALSKKLDGWSHKAVWGIGARTVKVKGLVGNRPGMTETQVSVESVSVRAGHVDGRWFVACWVKLEHEGKWKFDGAWRKWHGHDWPVGLPVELNSTQVNAYASASDVAGALAAIAPRAQVAA
jgi:hypothetical protein